MYLTHFGLSEMPFSITPDTSFTYSLPLHQEALNTVLLALEGGEGFVKITGEVGTGKTLLCRRLLGILQDDWVTAYLPNPNFDGLTLLRALAEELGCEDVAAHDHYHLLQRINVLLLDHASQGRRVAVCIDEAQSMPMETLEALRLLSNLETEKSKLLQIVLFGQPELDEKLRRPEVRQFLQRVAFHHRLRALDRQETARYVEHRLRVAGYKGDSLFSSGAQRALFSASGGTPRLINILAHKTLLAVFGQGRFKARTSHVRRAAMDTEGASRPGWLW